MSLKLPNYTQIEYDVYDANNMFLRDSTILSIKEAVARFRSATRFCRFDSAVYAAVEHIELKLKAFIPGSVMPPQFPHKPIEWPSTDQDDPYEGKWQWQRGWDQE